MRVVCLCVSMILEFVVNLSQEFRSGQGMIIIAVNPVVFKMEKNIKSF